MSPWLQGTSRFYAAGFAGDEAVIVREDHGTTVLARAPFAAEAGRRYRLELEVEGEDLTLRIDGQQVLRAGDGTFRYGMAGVRMASAGGMQVHRL